MSDDAMHEAPHENPLVELEFALAEGDAVEPADGLRARVLAAATAERRPGLAAGAPDRISGVETFRRAVQSLDALLGELSDDEWTRPALRDLDVQGLVGHLIGVETTFGGAVVAGHGGDLDHVASTQPAADEQRGKAPLTTHREWFDAATASLAIVSDLDGDEPTTFYGVTLPLDALLVVRAFEMWIHDEDIRRATGRPLAPPDDERLARMVALVTVLLPAGIARAGHARPGARARLVLTGRAGGTWDVNLDGSDADMSPAAARIVVDATVFCRVVGNREDLLGSDAIVAGDHSIAEGVFLGAAALALD